MKYQYYIEDIYIQFYEIYSNCDNKYKLKKKNLYLFKKYYLFKMYLNKIQFSDIFRQIFTKLKLIYKIYSNDKSFVLRSVILNICTYFEKI